MYIRKFFHNIPSVEIHQKMRFVANKGNKAHYNTHNCTKWNFLFEKNNTDQNHK